MVKPTNKGKWHVYIDRSLKGICKTLAAAENKQLGDFVSDILRKELLPEVKV